ncbi:hypothetical protein [Stenoxybacter acetivorans]|uniref:hypothetical protein n=1 Tax=Stenoxybacter acetivorans TaxID=422441 RepID=UPI000569B2BD|nr:hypothetical protein [Stenoxybacter acetivorans]
MFSFFKPVSALLQQPPISADGRRLLKQLKPGVQLTRRTSGVKATLIHMNFYLEDFLLIDEYGELISLKTSALFSEYLCCEVSRPSAANVDAAWQRADKAYDQQALYKGFWWRFCHLHPREMRRFLRRHRGE